MGEGVIYVATRAGYIDLAVQSARSFRASNRAVAVDLFTDDPGAPGLEVFDRVHPVPRVHARAKLDCMALSRFDTTLFLDADTLVVGDLGDLWRIAEVFDIAMAHDVRRRSALIREGVAIETPYAFPQLNSGVVLYRQSDAMAAFLSDWAGLYNDMGLKRDQTALKDLLWSTRLRLYVLPPEFNLRRVTVLDAWEPLDAEVKIIHSHRFMDHLRIHRARRISTLADLVEVERAALEAEWLAAGAPDRIVWFTQSGIQD